MCGSETSKCSGHAADEERLLPPATLPLSCECQISAIKIYLIHIFFSI